MTTPVLTAERVASAYAAWVEIGDQELAALSAEESFDHVSGTSGGRVVPLVTRWFEESFADRRVEIHAATQQADLVLLWMTIHGVHVGNGFPRMAGLPVRGREVAWPQLHVFRVVEDRIAEHWAVRDDFGMIEALRA